MLSSPKKPHQDQATDDEIFSSVQDELDAAVAGEAAWTWVEPFLP